MSCRVFFFSRSFLVMLEQLVTKSIIAETSIAILSRPSQFLRIFNAFYNVRTTVIARLYFKYFRVKKITILSEFASFMTSL
jgi:hypothetical protein